MFSTRALCFPPSVVFLTGISLLRTFPLCCAPPTPISACTIPCGSSCCHPITDHLHSSVENVSLLFKFSWRFLCFKSYFQMTIWFDIGFHILTSLVETKLLYIHFFFSKWQCAWDVNKTILHKILGLIIVILYFQCFFFHSINRYQECMCTIRINSIFFDDKQFGLHQTIYSVSSSFK